MYQSHKVTINKSQISKLQRSCFLDTMQSIRKQLKESFWGLAGGWGGGWGGHATQACGILVSQPGIQPVPACSGSSKSEPLNHQGSPKNHLKNKTNKKAKWILNGHFQDNNTGKLLNINSILYIRWHYYMKFLRVVSNSIVVMQENGLPSSRVGISESAVS